MNLEIKTNLRVFPFMVMDVTMRDYLKLSPTEALAAAKKIIAEVKAVDGLFTMMVLEENKIRTDPVARVSDVLKKVFGSLDTTN